jgi:hypothetical protein
MLGSDDVQSHQSGAFIGVCHPLWTTGFAIHFEPTSMVIPLDTRVLEVALTCAIMSRDSFGDSCAGIGFDAIMRIEDSS